jgi:hypothetical protein
VPLGRKGCRRRKEEGEGAEEGKGLEVVGGVGCGARKRGVMVGEMEVKEVVQRKATRPRSSGP